MTHPPGVEISLRHLPDLSDTSFSFQIPVATSDDLLADDDDFFRGADDSLITPAAIRTVQEPLTLSEITPKPKAKAESPTQPTIPLPELDHFPEPKPKPVRCGIAGSNIQAGIPGIQKASKGKVDLRPEVKVVTDALRTNSGENSSPMGRFENLRAEVETLVGNSQMSEHVSTQTHTSTALQKSKLRQGRGRVPNSNPKRTTSREISKPPKGGNKTSAPAHTRSIRPQPIEPTCQLDDFSSNSNTIQGEGEQPEDEINATGAVAERLIMFSQQLNSFGLLNSEKLPEPPQTRDDRITAQSPRNWRDSGPIANPIAPGNNVIDNNDNNLTLSQISPRKVLAYDENPLPPIPIPKSPMRPSSKRPVSVTEHQSRKRGKVAAAAPSMLRSLPKNISVVGGSGSGSHTYDKMKTRPVKTSNQVPEFRLDTTKGQSKLRTTGAARKQDEDCVGNSENQPVLAESNEGTSAARGHIPRFANPTSTLRHVNPTKAVGFKFQLDARMESRRAEFEKEKSVRQRRKQHNPLPVPDFRALHAAQEAEIAGRKERLMPVVPLPVELNTEGRAKERRKFDGIMKEKERELDMAVKQRQLEREEEEQREVRELRKKAIPRAHEVPQWYKDAPKRKFKNYDSTRG